MNNNKQQYTDVKNELSFKEEVFELLDTAVKTVVVALLVFTFVFSLSTVKGSSMLPTLQNNNRVLVYSMFYKPKSKDVVVITQPNYLDHILVKRVIATEGQTVFVDAEAGKVFVDGEELNEPYINEITKTAGDIKYPVTVPKDYIFAMGDNRNASLDSRYDSIGMINKNYVKGKVLFRFFPINKIGVIK